MASVTVPPPDLDKLPAEILNDIMPDVLTSTRPIFIKDEIKGAPVLQTSFRLKNMYLAMYLANNRFVVTHGCDLLKWISHMGGPHLLANVTKLAVQGRGYHFRPASRAGQVRPHAVDTGPITIYLTLHNGPATSGLSSSYITMNTLPGHAGVLRFQPDSNSLYKALQLPNKKLRGRANFGFVEMLRIASQLVNGSARWETNISIHGTTLPVPTINGFDLRSDLGKGTRPAENELHDFVREKTRARTNAARYRAKVKARRKPRGW